MKGQRFERGQALVLIVLSVVAIFGFAALAVDMGRVYAERRRAQSAADASALAAAYSIANVNKEVTKPMLKTAEQIARATALKNGYDGKTNNTIEFNTPPDDNDTSNYEECYCQYIQVIINSKVDPIFMQFLGRGASEIRTVSVARARLSQPLSTGNAIHALITKGENGGPGIVKDSGVKYKIQNGDTRSNDQGVPLVVPVPPQPECGKDAGSVSGNVYQPGNFDSITMGAGSWQMSKGMYCLGGDFTIESGAQVKGDGVLIIMKKGALTVNNGAIVQWKRPNDQLDKAGNQWGGMLIYAVSPDGKLTGDVTLNGSNSSSFTGTVFAPRSTCSYGGDSSFKPASTLQLVCHQVHLTNSAGGSSGPNLTFTYSDNQVYRMPPIVELVK